LIGFAQWWWSLPLMWLTARGRASRLLITGIDSLGQSAQLHGEDTLSAEMLGLMHLASAQCAARSQQCDEAMTHLLEADRIAKQVGECNSMRMHFGPTNALLWRLAVGIELDEGGRAYEEVTRASPDLAVLQSKDRTAALHFDLARALVQDGVQRDAEAIRHLDNADRLAPTRIRNDPIARDLVATLYRRARRQAWELDSLRNRFGVGGRGQQSVDN
jgi:hypothetical protein